MKAAILDKVRAARAAKRAVAVVTDIADGSQALVDREDTEGDLSLSDETLAEVRDALRHDRSMTIERDGRRLFIHAFTPPLRLVIVGAVHIAQPLARIALYSGYEVVLVDPRGAFATAERFPGLTLMEDWPDEALEKLNIDSRTAVVTLTHDPKLDDPALLVALRSEAFYIGSLGSRRTHAKRVDRLKEEGLTDEQIARIHAPVGLDLGGRAQAEIAIATMAQIVQALHAAPATPERKAEKAA
ncbi:xanthine dehydrogenase accessory factor [Constrictibacter sp. MBR-5]|jgi:xanthine dehydrogenase accessory factor|uniref:XdhC family protein n=1 Tax=Constrictibacter sp. MBR-5 TaxID=3156467 RepID=UPI00339A404B